MGEKDYSGINRSNGNVRGVSQRTINKKRGTLAHDFDGEITASDIQAQYSQVGISITPLEAQAIRSAVNSYSRDGYDVMVEAWRKQARGEQLSASEEYDYRAYKKCEEYLRVAPTFTSSQPEIYRGVRDSYDTQRQEYFNHLLSLKPGDTFDNDRRPTSYTSSFDMGKEFAGAKGAIIHAPVKKLRNSVSIVAISPSMSEQEVFSADYDWKVSRVSDLRNTSDGFYHIYLK